MSDSLRSESATTAQSGPEPQVLDPRRWKALILLCVNGFMVILDSQIVILALPSIERELRVAAGEGQWVLSAYMLAFGGLLLFGGRLADLRGRRQMFILGTVLVLVSSLLCGLAWSAGALIGARVVQGVSAAIMAPAALAILMNMFPAGATRNKALAYWSGVGGLGATAALLLGGPITQTLGWEWIFYLNVPVAVGLLAFAPILLRESQERDKAGSYAPAGALTITLGLMLRLRRPGRRDQGRSPPGWAVAIVLMGIGVFLLSQLSADGTYFGDLFPGLLVFGLGLGGGPVAAISAALSSVDQEIAGVASGASNAAFQIGGALGAAVVSGVVVSHGGDSTVPTVLTEGFQAGFTTDLVIALLGLCVTLLLLRPLTTMPTPNDPDRAETT